MPKVKFYLGDDPKPLNLNKKKDFKSHIQGNTYVGCESMMDKEQTFPIIYFIKTCLKIC